MQVRGDTSHIYALGGCFILLAIVLSVLLRNTDSDCPFGIFKLFLKTRLENSLNHC